MGHSIRMDTLRSSSRMFNNTGTLQSAQNPRKSGMVKIPRDFPEFSVYDEPTRRTSVSRGANKFARSYYANNADFANRGMPATSMNFMPTNFGGTGSVYNAKSRSALKNPHAVSMKFVPSTPTDVRTSHNLARIRDRNNLQASDNNEFDGHPSFQKKYLDRPNIVSQSYQVSPGGFNNLKQRR